MKLIHKIEDADTGYTTTVYRNAAWDEYVVYFYHEGSHLAEASYHTTMMTDAIDTATAFIRSKKRDLVKEMDIRESRMILIDNEDLSWEFADDWEGDHKNPVTITRRDAHSYELECQCYYGPGGELKLTITQPMGRAIRTFAKLLRVDSDEESVR